MAKIRILATEDDVLHADTLRMVIERLGDELIDVADSPAEALRLLKATQPDMLLADIGLGAERASPGSVESLSADTHALPNKIQHRLVCCL